MPTLKITRRKAGEAGKLRRIRVLANGVQIAKLRPGAAASVQLPAGSYEFIAKMDWFSSERLTFQLVDDATIQVAMPLGQAMSGYLRPREGISLTVE